MTTQKQTIANHLNARQSTGPISVDGKAVVAKNALKHGIFSKQILFRSLGELRNLQMARSLEHAIPITEIGFVPQKIIDASI